MASSTVGALNVVVGANAKKLQSKLKKARKSIANFSSRVGKAAKTVSKFGTVALGAVTAATGALVNKNLKAIDTINKLSDRTGVATEKMAGLTRAAEQNGASANQVADALDKMDKRLGEVAATGNGAAKKGLDILGLKAEELAQKAPDERMKIVAERIRGLDSSAKKAAATSALFSQANQNLVNTLEQGRVGFNKAQKEAEKFGTAVDKQSANKASKAVDAIGNIKDAFTGAAQSLTIALAPAITKGANAIANFIQKGLPLIKSFVKSVISFFKPVVQAIQANYKQSLKITVGMMQAIWGVIKAIGNAVISIWTSVFGKTNKNTKDFASSVISIWNWIRSGVVKALRYIEFGIKNFEDIMSLRFLQVQHTIVKFKNQFVWYFTKALPQAIKAFINKPGTVIKEWAKTLWTTFKRAIGNVGRIVSMLPSIISGSVSISEITKPVTKEMKDFYNDVLELPERKKGDLEKELGNEVDSAKKNLNRKFRDFMNEKERQAKKTTQNILGFSKGLSDDPTGGANNRQTSNIGNNIGNAVGNTLKNKGKDIGNEISKGMENNKPELIKASSAEARAMSFSEGVTKNKGNKTEQDQLKYLKQQNQIMSKINQNVKNSGNNLQEFSMS